MTVEKDGTLTLSNDDPVNFSRPSIDVLFDSVADAYKEKSMGVVLTGASADGARGLANIHRNGGLAVVQKPEVAVNKFMPQAAINENQPDYVMTESEIADLLNTISAARSTSLRVSSETLR